jgi:hypothetical protein
MQFLMIWLLCDLVAYEGGLKIMSTMEMKMKMKAFPLFRLQPM